MLQQSAALAIATTSLTWLVSYLVAKRVARREDEKDDVRSSEDVLLRGVKSEGSLLPPRYDRPRSPGWFHEDVQMHSLAASAMQHVALVVVDCQPVYWDEQSVVRDAFPRLPKEVRSLLKRARRDLSPPQIVHVRANYTFRFAQNFKRLNPEKPLPSDIQAVSWASSRVGEQIVVKSSFDSFHETNLEQYLRDLGVTDVVICGLLTSCCVLFSAQSAFASGFRVRLYEPACGDRSKQRHEQTLDTYGSYCFEVFDDLDQCFNWTGYPNQVSPNNSRDSFERGSVCSSSAADLAAI